MATKKLCPCGSGRVYRDCCMPFHRGAAEAPDAEALMRSRYSAFALKEAEYLWRTLHETNEEWLQGRQEVIRAIKGSGLRFMGLTVLDARLVEPPGPSQVLFLAKVFDKGRDVSFADGVSWLSLGRESPSRPAAAEGADAAVASRVHRDQDRGLERTGRSPVPLWGCLREVAVATGFEMPLLERRMGARLPPMEHRVYRGSSAAEVTRGRSEVRKPSVSFARAFALASCVAICGTPWHS